MATMKKCFNDVHLRKLLVCAIFITLKSCCCTNISRNAITLIDSFSPMFHGMRIEDDCRRSNAYHTCGCRCVCSYSNSTFDESSQKCVNNAELRRREGCKYSFVHKSKEDPPIVLSRTASSGFPNKFELDIPIGQECRFYMWDHNKYLSCDGSWKSLTSTHVHHTFNLDYDFTARQSFLELVSNKPDGKFPFLNGRLVRLAVDCKATDAERVDRSCVLVKLDGTINCPYANQRSMFWLWNQWQKEHADNLTTSSQTDYLETSYSSGYSSNYETLSQSVKPNSCHCVYPPRATPSPLTTPPFPHQTVPRESAIQQTATISNYVQVTKTPTLAVPATRTLSLLLVTHSLKKYTTATTLYSKPENESLNVNDVYRESGEKSSLSLMAVVGISVAGAFLIVLTVLFISLVQLKIKRQRSVSRITATGEKETSNTNTDENNDVYEEPCTLQLNNVAIEDVNGNMNSRRTSAEPLVPANNGHPRKKRSSTYEDIELVKYSVNDLYEATSTNHEGHLGTRIESQAADIKDFFCNPIYPTIAVAVSAENTDNEMETQGRVGISNDSNVSSSAILETSGLYQNNARSTVDGVECSSNGFGGTVGGRPVFQRRTSSRHASLVGEDFEEETSYQNIGSSGSGTDDPSGMFQELGETTADFDNILHKYDVAESILGSEYTVAELPGIKSVKSAGSLPKITCGRRHSYYDAGDTI